MKCSICNQEGHTKRSCELNIQDNNKLKTQRKTKNLGYNTSNTQEESYIKIETKTSTAKCSDINHTGDRILSIRNFYLNKGGNSLQSACIICQKNRRANRIKKSREKFNGKTKEEICNMYIKTYGQTKTCSICKIAKNPLEFPLSISMETGFHNHCIDCSNNNHSRSGLFRDFTFLPDKDNFKYKKKKQCERCGDINRLVIDHILPISKGGSDCLINKQTLCNHCNCKKNSTIDSTIKSEFLCERYKDESLNFSNNTELTRVLSKKVYEFRQKNIINISKDELRNNIKNYITKYNLGHNLDRIINKIVLFFNNK